MNMPKQKSGETDNHYYARCRQPRTGAQFVLTTRHGWILNNGQSTRDINRGSVAVFSSLEKAMEFRSKYVAARWNVGVEELG